MIYEKAKNVFYSWRDYDVETVQAKRKWIVDALEVMFAMKLLGRTIDKSSWLVPIPTIRPKIQIEEAICKKLARYILKISKPRKSRISRIKRSKPRRGLNITTLTDFS